MPMNSASIYKSIEPVTRHFWGLAQQEAKPIFSQIFETETTDEPILDAVEYGGPGAMKWKAENDRIFSDEIIQGVNKRWAAQTFATAIEISLEAVEDTKYSAIKTAAKSLGRSAALTPEYLAAQFLDRAFNTSYPALGDNLTLCNAAHLIPKGGTYSNALTTPYSLSEFALEQIFQNLAVIPGTDGMLMPLQPEKLVVPVALGPLAWKLSQTQLQVGSANNDLSFIAGKFQPIVFNYLGSNTRYFVTTNADDGLFWKWRVKPQFMRDNVDMLTQALFISRFRAYWGCIDGRGIYGSNAV
jgi:hypothetical protein